MNTDLPTGDQEMPPEWHRFHDFIESAEELQIGRLIQNGTERELSDAEVAAYDAPFGTEAEKAGAYAWPDMVPRQGGGDGAALTTAARERLCTWEKPVFVLFSDGDPITRDARDELRALFPTANSQPDLWVSNAGHYLQEDAPKGIADRIVRFVDRT
jgi:haloalkane dehalogenase